MSKKNLNENNENLFNLYADYEKIVQNEKYINFEKYMATILLNNNLGFNSPIFKDYYARLENAIKNKYDLVFRDFVVTFNLNLKFSQNILVPELALKESTANEAYNFKSSKDNVLNEFYNDIATTLANLIINGSYVEFIPNLVIYKSQNSNTLKLLFAKSLTAKVGE